MRRMNLPARSPCQSHILSLAARLPPSLSPISCRFSRQRMALEVALRARRRTAIRALYVHLHIWTLERTPGTLRDASPQLRILSIAADRTAAITLRVELDRICQLSSHPLPSSATSHGRWGGLSGTGGHRLVLTLFVKDALLDEVPVERLHL